MSSDLCSYFFVSGLNLHVEGAMVTCELSSVVQPRLAR